MSDVAGVNDKSGFVGSALIASTAILNVPVTSILAALLNPMWLSLICTNENSFFLNAALAAAESMPPAPRVQTIPPPVHPMCSMKFRRFKA